MISTVSKTNVALDGTDVVLSRTFNAPRALVYKAWTDPKHLAQWWGPKVFTNPVCEVDLHVGGAFRIVMRGPDGVDYPLNGVYREIIPDERLVCVIDLEEHPGDWHERLKKNVGPATSDPTKEMLWTVTFAEQNGVTKLTVRTHFPSADVRDAFLKMQMAEGWTESFEKLEALVENV